MNNGIILGATAIAVGFLLHMYSQMMRDVPANHIQPVAVPTQMSTSAP